LTDPTLPNSSFSQSILLHNRSNPHPSLGQVHLNLNSSFKQNFASADFKTKNSTFRDSSALKSILILQNVKQNVKRQPIFDLSLDYVYLSCQTHRQFLFSVVCMLFSHLSLFCVLSLPKFISFNVFQFQSLSIFSIFPFSAISPLFHERRISITSTYFSDLERRRKMFPADLLETFLLILVSEKRKGNQLQEQEGSGKRERLG